MYTFSMCIRIPFLKVIELAQLSQPPPPHAHDLNAIREDFADSHAHGRSFAIAPETQSNYINT